VLAAALTMPAIVLAAPPVETVETTWGTRPGAITTEDGTLDFYVLYTDLPYLVGDFSYTGPHGNLAGYERTASVDGNRLTGDMWVIDSDTQEFVGIATYEIDFTTGEPVVEVDDRSAGNRRSIVTSTRYPATVNGSFTLPNGTVFPLVNRPGSHQVYETWSNSPASTVLDGHHTFVAARWTLGEMDIALVASETAIATETYVTMSTLEGELVGAGSVHFVDGRLVGELDLLRNDLSVGGTAAFDVTIEMLGSSWAFEDYGYERMRVVTDEIVASGTLSLVVDGESLELSLDDAEVDATRQSWHGIRYPSKGDEPQD
jgi:hypothetical protein